MNDFDVISVPTFSDFVTEVGKEQTVRLNLCERHNPERYGSEADAITVPAKRVTLDVQGLNRDGDLVWLNLRTTIHWNNWSNDGPRTPREKEWYDGMVELHRIVQDTLKKTGYQVRSGRYVLPNDCVPINGYFDCAEWYEDEEGHISVRPVEFSPPSQVVQMRKFRFDLHDGFDLTGYPPVPIEIEIDANKVSIRVPATNDEVYAAKVEVEHWDRWLSVRVWDQETMRRREDGPPTTSCELLNTWEDR